jgi:phage-related protein
LFTLKIGNNRGSIYELTHNTGRYAVVGIDGLTRPPTNINTAIAGGIDGSFFNSARVEQRNLVISIILRGDIETNRQALYTIFPLKSKCTIYFSNKNRDVKIEGFVETLEADLFTMQERVQVSIICPRPYWQDMNEIIDSISTTVNLFQFPFSISEPIPFAEIYNEPHAFLNNLGDSETGFTIVTTLEKNLSTLTFTNLTTGEFFKVDYTMLEGDTFILSTIQGGLNVRIEREGSSINLLNYIGAGSSWIKLVTGLNDITYSCGSDEADFPIAINAIWLYGGV